MASWRGFAPRNEHEKRPERPLGGHERAETEVRPLPPIRGPFRGLGGSVSGRANGPRAGPNRSTRAVVANTTATTHREHARWVGAS